MSDANSSGTNIGKKVFFLYPHSVIQDQLIQIILQAEYEVYLIKDHRKAIGLMKLYPDSILFINIDERIKDHNWEEYVRSLMADEATKNVQIGILSYNEDAALTRKYLMDLSVPCGFIRLKIGIKESAKIILTALEANEARGKRKHVRAEIPQDMPVSFNIKFDGGYSKGSIKDISAIGMACIFDESVKLQTGTKLDDIQLNLRGVNIRVGGIVAGSRDSDFGRVFVMMFTTGRDSSVRTKLHTFIYNVLQSQMERKMNTL